MAMPPEAYEESRRTAKYHMQVAVRDRDLEWTKPERLSMRCRVHKVFRGDAAVFAGDTVCFSVAVHRGHFPAGGDMWLSWDDYLAVKFFEVFLDGSPPDCHAARSQWFRIEALSDRPQIDVATGRPIGAEIPSSPSALNRLFSRRG